MIGFFGWLIGVRLIEDDDEHFLVKVPFYCRSVESKERVIEKIEDNYDRKHADTAIIGEIRSSRLLNFDIVPRDTGLCGKPVPGFFCVRERGHDGACGLPPIHATRGGLRFRDPGEYEQATD
jgi:hypothetical protein